MNIELLNGDCLSLMSSIPDGSVDAIICDLPYGTTACKWDTVIPFEPLWAHYKRVIKPNGAIVLFGSQPFTSALVMSNPNAFKHEWIWKKSQGSNFANVKHAPFKEHESIVVFATKSGGLYIPQMQKRSAAGVSRKKYRHTNTPTDGVIGKTIACEMATDSELRYPSSVQPFNNEKGLHPTQKPVALLEYLIRITKIVLY